MVVHLNTAASFSGDGSGLTGVGNTANVNLNSLVSGVSTLGIECATYYGDGSNLTGVGDTANIVSDTIDSGSINVKWYTIII